MGFLQTKNGKYILVTLTGCFVSLSVIMLVVGVVEYQKKKDKDCATITTSPVTHPDNQHREKLIKFLNKVKSTYYELYPHTIIFDPDVQFDEIIDNFTPYDPSPKAIKMRTDRALALSKELEELGLNSTQLKPREKKAAAQLEHYLYSMFGNPYDENYYAGDWMMGPNYFCWQHICSIGSDLAQHYSKISGVLPKTMKDVEKLLSTVKNYSTRMERYTQNMMYGVKAGMVRAVDDCKSGRNAFKSRFRHIAAEGEMGALKESFSAQLIQTNFYKAIPESTRRIFEEKYKEKMEAKMAEQIVMHIGRPVAQFIKFLDSNYSRYCVPSSVASGLANLPIDKVWLDQSETSEVTTKKLPTGEKLDGKKSYDMILPYFTTSKKYNAKTVNELGEKQKDKLYRQAVEIAKKIIKNKSENESVAQFKVDLDLPKHYFNTSVIPDNENDEEGGRRCYDMASAKKNCPVRYKAMQDWFAYVNRVLSLIEPMTINMFYMTGEKVTTPNCPVKMRARFNPSSGSQSYSASGKNCSRSCYYNLPFFLLRPGPIYGAYSVAGHEARPGHHTQVQGFREHFASYGKRDVIDWLNVNNAYTAFTEGWALYAENPLLSQGTALYKNEPMQEYGMLKWQIWRALRLIIDTGLHARGMTQQQSLDLFEEFAWDTTDKSKKDTVRYMSDPGQATAYMIGQLAIWNMRNNTIEKFKEARIKFDEKEFHYQILSQGSSPLEYLNTYIDDFIKCKIDKSARSDCPEILDPKLSSQQKSKPIGTASRWEFIENNIQERERYF